jgi:hypothetical protein
MPSSAKPIHNALVIAGGMPHTNRPEYSWMPSAAAIANLNGLLGSRSRAFVFAERQPGYAEQQQRSLDSDANAWHRAFNAELVQAFAGSTMPSVSLQTADTTISYPLGPRAAGGKQSVIGYNDAQQADTAIHILTPGYWKHGFGKYAASERLLRGIVRELQGIRGILTIDPGDYHTDLTSLFMDKPAQSKRFERIVVITWDDVMPVIAVNCKVAGSLRQAVLNSA